MPMYLHIGIALIGTLIFCLGMIMFMIAGRLACQAGKKEMIPIIGGVSVFCIFLWQTYHL